jgi:hypothetical protein
MAARDLTIKHTGFDRISFTEPIRWNNLRVWVMLLPAIRQTPWIVILCSVGWIFELSRSEADEPALLELVGDRGLQAWRKPTGDWIVAAAALPDPARTNRLTAEPGQGTLINGVTGKTRNLLTSEDFGDVDTHFEFLIPKGSNSGVKFEGLYEIQIIDSFGVAKPDGHHCGGIYPRAELLPKYHYLDEGTPPLLNAARPPGEWQTLDVVFRAPRFDSSGKKIKNARFDKVVLNSQVIHQNVELKTPTGHYWRNKEVERGPILLQGDHGPVAFRNIRVRPL